VKIFDALKKSVNVEQSEDFSWHDSLAKHSKVQSFLRPEQDVHSVRL